MTRPPWIIPRKALLALLSPEGVAVKPEVVIGYCAVGITWETPTGDYVAIVIDEEWAHNGTVLVKAFVNGDRSCSDVSFDGATFPQTAMEHLRASGIREEVAR